MRTISLQELKYLKAFVRFQEIPSRLRSIEREHGTIRRYPLFEGWSEPDSQIDVFNGHEWRRVRFLRKQDDKIVYVYDENTLSQPTNPYTVAPAGYFTDFEAHEIDLPDIEISRNTEIPVKEEIIPRGWRTCSSEVRCIDWPYVTLRVKFIPPNVGGLIKYRKLDLRFHVADSRLNGNAELSKPPPLFNSPIAVSHRWKDEKEQPRHPDPYGHQFDELLVRAEEMCLHKYQPFLIDYCVLPQQPRTSGEQQEYETKLRAFHQFFKDCLSMVIRYGAEDYHERGWCMLELTLIALSGSFADHPEKLTGTPKLPQGVEKAWNEAINHNLTINELKKLNAEFTNRGNDFFADDPLNKKAAFSEAMQSQRKKIINQFKQKYEYSIPSDSDHTVRILKDLVF